MQDTESKNKSLDQQILAVEKGAKVGAKIRVIRDGAEVKRGNIVRITSIGAYIHKPKYHFNDSEQDPAGCSEFFAFRNYKNNKLAGGIVLVGAN